MHKVTLQPSGQSFHVDEGESVLAAALRQGVMLPYGCSNGACGSCKGKIVAGSVDYGVYQEQALTDDERAQGKALFCQAKPLSDLVIECRTIGAAKDIADQDAAVPRAEDGARRRRRDGRCSSSCRRTSGCSFLAGQYIDFLLKDGARRSFSMANPPHDDELIELHVRHVAGRPVHRPRVQQDEGARHPALRGTARHASSCARTAPSRSCSSRRGTGFAPIKAIIEHALHTGVERPMTLYWGGRRPKDLYMNELAERWALSSRLPLRAGDLRSAARGPLDRPHAASCTAR